MPSTHRYFVAAVRMTVPGPTSRAKLARNGWNSVGASAPAKDLFKAYGFTAERVIEAIEKVLGT